MKIKKTNKQINKAEVVVTANEVENCVPLKKVIIDLFNNDLMISEKRGAATKHHTALNHHGGQICEVKFGFS